MADRIQDLGVFTAYGEAREAGYEGSKAEFELGLKKSAEYAENAQASADAAAASADDAELSAAGAAESAEDAETSAGEATQSATDAAASAAAAADSATAAAASATQAASNAQAALGDIAPIFDATKEYSVGDYVIYTDGKLYRFTADHAAGAWVGTDAEMAVVGDEISELKSALNEDESILLNIQENDVTNEIIPTMTSGVCTTDGTITASSNYEYTPILPVKAGDIIHCKATAISGQNPPTDPCYVRYVTAYAGQTADSSKGEGTGQTQNYIVPSGVDGIRLTLNLQLYTSGSLVVYHETTEAKKSANYDGLVSTVYGNNFIDKSKFTTGAVQSDGTISTAGTYSTYKTSEYIPVKGTKAYKLYVGNAIGLDTDSATRLIYLLYDADRRPLTYANESPVTDLTISPATNGYIRVCANDAEAYPIFGTKLMLIEGTDYVPYEPYSVEKILDNDISPINDKFLCNILNGKKWCPCGDSFTEYTNAKFTDGKYSGRDKTYPYLIALRNNMKIDARFFKSGSGRTMAYPADGTFSNSLTCPTNVGYYQNIPEDADYITIMLGINDYQHSRSGTTGIIPLGTIDDNTTDTYYGAYNVVLGWIRDNRPFAHVGIIVTNGTERQDYTEAQVALARKWGYPLLNLNGDDHTPAMIRCYNANMSEELKTLIKQKQAVDYDGSQTGSVNTHPNYEAHEYESAFIEAWLRIL